MAATAGRVLCATAVLLALGFASHGVGRAESGGSSPALPGAYCPLPEPGEKPVCIDAARSEYGDFLEAVEAGEAPADSPALMDDLLSADRAYLALSSLAYGYYRLAEVAAAEPSPDPVLLRRLADWNSQLAALYEGRPPDDPLRGAIEEAAEDLHRRAPRTTCADGSTGPACDSTSLLLATLQAANRESSTHGVTGALSRLLERVSGTEATAQGAHPGSERGAETE